MATVSTSENWAWTIEDRSVNNPVRKKIGVLKVFLIFCMLIENRHRHSCHYKFDRKLTNLFWSNITLQRISYAIALFRFMEYLFCTLGSSKQKSLMGCFSFLFYFFLMIKISIKVLFVIFIVISILFPYLYEFGVHIFFNIRIVRIIVKIIHFMRVVL